VLLDTGCSVPLVNQETAQRLQVPMLKDDPAIRIENYTGQHVEKAGIYYTKPLLLQHRQHFSKETFEVTPMEPEVDHFLPYWWISRHPPQEIWESEEIGFNSPGCQETCTRYEKGEFLLNLDEEVAYDPNARVIGHISAVTTDDALASVPGEFRPYLGIMSKEAVDTLPQHRPYDCKIELKEGSTAPWGPIYPLSEVELQTLREWLKEMERTGKIKRSTSPAGSPILFVPKPHGRGLRLCVDYRALNQITVPNRYPLPLMQELSRSCLDFSVCLDRQRRRSLQRERSYSHFWCTHTSGVLTLQAYSHALRELGVLAVSVTPGVVSSRLFSHALHGLVVLAVSVMPGVVSSWLFSHALHGLVVLVVSVTPGVVSSRLVSHALRGLVVLVVSVTPGVVSSRLF